MNVPQFCYVVVPGAVPGERIGVVERGKEGYYPTDFDSPKASDKTIRNFVAGMNARLGVDAGEAQAMLYGSMFGWDDPAAKNDCEARRSFPQADKQDLHAGTVSGSAQEDARVTRGTNMNGH